jgi:hypothetical protein
MAAVAAGSALTPTELGGHKIPSPGRPLSDWDTLTRSWSRGEGRAVDGCGGALAFRAGGRAGQHHPSEVVAADDPQVGPVLLGLQDRRLPLPGQILEAVGVEQRLWNSRR